MEKRKAPPGEAFVTRCQLGTVFKAYSMFLVYIETIAFESGRC